MPAAGLEMAAAPSEAPKTLWTAGRFERSEAQVLAWLAKGVDRVGQWAVGFCAYMLVVTGGPPHDGGMASSSVSRGTVVAWARQLVIAGVLAELVLLAVSNGQLRSGYRVAALTIALLTVSAVWVTPWKWGRMNEHSPAPSQETIDEVKEAFARSVSHECQVEAALREVDDPAPIPIQWRLTGRRQVLDRTTNASLTCPIASSADIAGLAARFREMGRGRLVILGGPGTGKTTLAVQLVRELTDTRSRHPDEPVPVLLSLADWDANRCLELREWLAARLTRDYRSLEGTVSSASALAALAAEGRILPVLDGFGELAPQDRIAVIKALNRSGGGNDEFILTARTAEYVQAVQEATGPLRGAVVIEPEPIDRTVAADYLKRCLPESLWPAWEPTLAALRSTGSLSGSAAVLAEVTATPLGLWLLRVAARGDYGDPSPLLNSSNYSHAESLHALLLERLVPALVSNRQTGGERASRFRRRHRYDAHEVRRYLGYLAHQMADQPLRNGIRSPSDLAWWRLAHLTGVFTKRTRVALASLALCLYLVALAVVMTAWRGLGNDEGGIWADRLRAISLVESLYPAGFVALVAAAIVYVSTGSWDLDKPGFADLGVRRHVLLLVQSLWRSVPSALRVGLILGLPVGLLWSFPLNGPKRIVSIVGISLLFVLGAWLIGAVAVFGRYPKLERRASAPMDSWRLDRSLNLMRIAFPGMVFGFGLFVFNLYLYFRRPKAVRLPWAAAASTVLFIALLVVCLLLVFAFSRHRAWCAYVVASYRLALDRKLPRRLMPFLEECHRLGLLRAVGPVYQFRHSWLQEHLVAAYKADASLS